MMRALIPCSKKQDVVDGKLDVVDGKLEVVDGKMDDLKENLSSKRLFDSL